MGAVLSPPLLNVVLDEFDWELARRGHRFVRLPTTDSVYVRSEAGGRRVMASITHYIEQRLKLKVNREKSVVDRATKRPFLGFGFRYRGGEVKSQSPPKPRTEQSSACAS